MKNFDIIAFIYFLIVIFMIVGSGIFIIKQLRYNFKYTLFIFICIVIGLGLICLYNYLKYFK